jgi:NhaP-type Na+/H+ or K+/H+ antiporter
MAWDLATVAAVLLGFALVSQRLKGTAVSAAIVFVAAGLALGTEGLDVFDVQIGSGFVKVLAEVTLGLVLFTDAASINTRRLSREKALPTRLLLIGLPLTIVLGTLVGLPIFGGLAFFEVVVLAILLAPTDAALGASVVSDERLPSELRQGLNVESGLNDGICVPLLFAAIAFAELEERPAFEGGILTELVKEVAIATGVGLAAGAVAALLLLASKSRGWILPAWVQVVPLATVVIAYTSATELGGSGFVAAFAAGLAYRWLAGGEQAETSVLFTEELGSVLSAVTFFVFGAAVVGVALDGLSAQDFLYAFLSLTVVRMLPVAAAFVGTGARPPTIAFAGWFGPRGLASIVFALIIVQESELAGTATIVRVTVLTVLLSVFAHGVTAPWLTSRYAGWLAAKRPG